MKPSVISFIWNLLPDHRWSDTRFDSHTTVSVIAVTVGKPAFPEHRSMQIGAL
jgi:hypothetical protein